MNSTKKAARFAGLLYVLVSLPGFFSLMYVPSVLIVRGDAAATASKILASELLFRIGIASNLIGQVGFIFVVLALYRLLAGVDKKQASLMVLLFVVSVPISILNELNQIAALALFHGADYLSVFGEAQRNSLAMLFLQLHGQGIDLAAIFWGLWLFPFGILVYKSGFLPRILGIWLMIDCFGFPVVSFTSLLAPHYVHIVSQFAMVPELGEIAIMLWLLIMGAKDQPLDAAA